jgi:hypothetical protein
MTMAVLTVWGLAMGWWGIDSAKTIITHTCTAWRAAWTAAQERRQPWQ